jgi:peptidoglycan/xylan/chitin deacetylase (PgdA/CDA1 family)
MNLGTRLRRVVASLRRGSRGGGVVLMYHRVTSGVVDPWRLCVSPRNFAEQLDVLSGTCHTVPLGDLISACREEGARGHVAITFDDGYADNLHEAAPALARARLPATFFLTSGMLGQGREFWWDELDGLLLGKAALPARLSISINGGSRVFEPGAAAAPLPDPASAVRACQPWDAPADTRLGFYYRIWQELQPLEDLQRRRALEDIRGQVGTPASVRDSHRVLTREEALSLAAQPRIDIGAHSVTHAPLVARTREQQLHEMAGSKRDLESLIGRPVRAFAYPYGSLGRESPQLARSAGFELACTTRPGDVGRLTDPHEVPRIAVEDWDGETFARRLAAVL